MRVALLSVGVVACGAPSATSAPAPGGEGLVLAVGGQTVVSARQAESYRLAEGNGAVTVKLSTDGLFFVILGVREGHETMSIQRTFEMEQMPIAVRGDAPRIVPGVFDETHSLVLAPGESVPISGVGVRSFSVAPGGAIDVVAADDGRTMSIEARSLGRSSVLLFMEPARKVYYDVEVAAGATP